MGRLSTPNTPKQPVQNFHGKAIRHLEHLLQVAVESYPSKLLPVVLNTNSSTLNADEGIWPRCMSGNLYVEDGEVVEGYSAHTLIEKIGAQRTV